MCVCVSRSLNQIVEISLILISYLAVGRRSSGMSEGCLGSNHRANRNTRASVFASPVAFLSHRLRFDVRLLQRVPVSLSSPDQ